MIRPFLSGLLDGDKFPKTAAFVSASPLDFKPAPGLLFTSGTTARRIRPSARMNMVIRPL
jgi:hypothetical protein